MDEEPRVVVAGAKIQVALCRNVDLLSRGVLGGVGLNYRSISLLQVAKDLLQLPKPSYLLLPNEDICDRPLVLSCGVGHKLRPPADISLLANTRC